MNKKRRKNPMTFIGAFRAKDGVILVADQIAITYPYGTYKDDYNKILEIKKINGYCLFGNSVEYFKKRYEKFVNQPLLRHKNKINKNEFDLFNTIGEIIKKTQNISIKRKIDRLNFPTYRGVVLIFVFTEPEIIIRKISLLEYEDMGESEEENIDGYVAFSPLGDTKTEQIIINSGYNKNSELEEVEEIVRKIYDEINSLTLFIGGEPNIIPIRIK